ncbi:MAG: HlyD family efflux transporter periplasmic adaptor subunit [Bradyrhizobium sp.]|uniref:HlyD family secretion protein n=1 Tax=Bradyrhizobium sp. TaxID=376 RepID=UPI001D4A9F6D|nr:HlyD family secretion protein [Bradyrhizobium sp.]MBV9563825.1 HlyD family efflux transporter periplasmic adaptor subunit [Bradyrhizobium sp.]
MPAEQRKASNTGAEVSESSPLSHPASSEPIDAAVTDRFGSLDVRAQSALLQEAFEASGSPELDMAVSASAPRRRGILARFGWRVFKSALGLGIVVIAGVGPVQRLLELSSADAVINARLVSLRAPIEGKVERADLFPTIGATAPKGRAMLRISNSRADRARLDDLQRQVDQTEAERPVIVKRLSSLKELHEQISKQARAFQAGRIRELEARVLDLKAQASATDALETEAASTLARTKGLAASGFQTAVAVERAERDEKVAAQNQRSLNHRLFASEVELEGARRGEYVGDSYNDRPSSLQHMDDLSIRLAETESELNVYDQRLAKLHAALDAEASRYSELSSVVLSSPAEASVWEILVAPGEEVRKGQDLLRLLDCSGTIISATVRETVYNQLRLGDNAQFRFSGQSKKYSGTIVRMSGSAAPPDNLAIQPTGLSSGGYRVAVSVPELATTQCAVGHSGTVVFNPSAAGSGTLQSLREAMSFFLPS